MINKCDGCGAVFQTNDPLKEGYVTDVEQKLCERCFRIRNYNDYQVIKKDNDSFIEILNNINTTSSLVVLVVDILNINKDLKEITKYLDNDILLVYTKRDLLPRSLVDERLTDYEIGLNPVDKIIISSDKNHNLDEVYEMIYKYKNDNDVYFIGYSNVGKSTLINKIIYNYSDIDTSITTSNLPSTTIDLIKIKLNDELTIIDTPGILEDGNITNYLDGKQLKSIQPKREIKPITYQVRDRQYILIEDLVIIEMNNSNDITLFIANNLKTHRKYKTVETNLELHELDLEDNSDIVILGLGFIKVKYQDKINVYTLDNVDVFVRPSLI